MSSQAPITRGRPPPLMAATARDARELLIARMGGDGDLELSFGRGWDTLVLGFLDSCAESLRTLLQPACQPLGSSQDPPPTPGASRHTDSHKSTIHTMLAVLGVVRDADGMAMCRGRSGAVCRLAQMGGSTARRWRRWGLGTCDSNFDNAKPCEAAKHLLLAAGTGRHGGRPCQ